MSQSNNTTTSFDVKIGVLGVKRMTNNNEIIIYQSEDGQTQVDVRMENDTVWLTQAQMAELFQTDRTSIVRHINNIYKVEELERESTCAKIAQVQINESLSSI